jgi:putative phosphoesterase
MRLGLISDIHADPRALEATLRHLDAWGISLIVCAGDLVGYGSQPDAAVELVRTRGIPCVRGNHDRWALERRQLIGPRGWRAADLSDETWDYLASLPAELHLEIDGRPVLIHHGSPAGDMEFVTPYKPMPPSIERLRTTTQDALVVLGHTHIPMVDRDPRATVVNPGSILGVPGIQTSYSFAIVEFDTLHVRFHEVRTGRETHRDPIFWVDA